MNARISELPAWALVGLLGLGLLGAAASLSLGTQAQRRGREFPPPLERPLPKGLTRQALLASLGGQTRVAADLAYIECLQYIGGARSDGFYGRTLELYAEVQWLDPSFRHAVREGIAVLGWMLRRPDEAVVLGQAALRSDPAEARYGAYMAALAYQQHLDIDGVLAALLPETRRPDAPEMLLRMVGNLYLRQGAWDQAVRYWAEVAPRLQDPISQALALKSIAAAKAHHHTIYQP